MAASGTNSMEHFIVMINSLQIAIHLPILNVLLPSNVVMFFEKLLPIVMFDIIKDEWRINPSDFLQYDEENNGLIDNPKFPRQMANIGYDTHNFLQNVGSLQIFLLVYFLRILFTLTLKVVNLLTGAGSELLKKQLKRIFFTDLILIFIEGYMEFLIAGYLQYGNDSINMSYSGEKIAGYLGNFSIIVSIILIPLGFVFMLSRRTEVIQSQSFRDKYGGLYEGI